MWPGPTTQSDTPTIPDLAHHSTPPPYTPVATPVPPSARPPVAPTRRVTRLERTGNKGAQVVAFLAEVIAAILILRIVLLFLAASSLAPFAQVIALLSTPLVLPFGGLFTPILFFQGQVDLAAVVAIITYSLVARIFESFIRLVTRW